MSLLGRLLREEPGIIDALLYYENKGQFGGYATEYKLTQ